MIYRQPTQLSQYCRYRVFLLSTYVKRFQRRYSGQPPPHSIAPTCGSLLLLYRQWHYISKCCHYSEVILLLLSWNSYNTFVPKLCRPITYQDKHDRWSITPTLHHSRTAQKNYEYSNYWTICPPQKLRPTLLCRYFIGWYISPCGRPTTLLCTRYSGQQGIFYRPHRGMVLYNYTLSQLQLLVS